MNIGGLVVLCLDVSPHEQPSRVLGDFQLRERLGGGGMGSMWRAWQYSLQREVALKILHEDLAREPEFIEAFRREVEITAPLRHPGIVPIYASSEIGRWLLLSCGGENLRFWETGSWEAGPAFPCPDCDAFIVFSPDDTWLAVSRRLPAESSIELLQAPRQGNETENRTR